jgi:hypothetical protein
MLLEDARLMVAAVEDGVVGNLVRCSKRCACSFITTLGLVLAVLAGLTLIASPMPCSDHSFFSNSFSLLAIRVLAALRMRAVER